MYRISKLAIVATVMLATATGAMAATKKHAEIETPLPRSLAASATTPPRSPPSDPVHFDRAKGGLGY